MRSVDRLFRSLETTIGKKFGKICERSNTRVIADRYLLASKTFRMNRMKTWRGNQHGFHPIDCALVLNKEYYHRCSSISVRICLGDHVGCYEDPEDSNYSSGEKWSARWQVMVAIGSQRGAAKILPISDASAPVLDEISFAVLGLPSERTWSHSASNAILKAAFWCG